MFWGAIGLHKNVASEPEKDRIDRRPQPYHHLAKRQLGLPPKKERAYQGNIQEKTYLTIQPLSGMSDQLHKVRVKRDQNGW